MKRLILLIPLFCIVFTTLAQQKISQYTRTTNLYGASVPYKPDSALSEFSVYNSAGSYSTRAITYYTLRTLLAASLAGIDTSYFSTTGDTGYGPYTINGLFRSNHGYNYLANTDTLIQPGMLHFVGAYRKDSVGAAVGYLMNGIMVKAADTSAGLAYGLGTIARRISLHKTFMDMYWGRSTSSYNKINIADDLMVFYMKGSPTMDFDTTGRTYLYNNLLLQNGALFDNTATDTLELFENTVKLTGNFNVTGTTQIGADSDSSFIIPSAGKGFDLQRGVTGNVSSSLMYLHKSTIYGTAFIGTRSYNMLISEDPTATPIAFIGNTLFQNGLTANGNTYIGNGNDTLFYDLSNGSGSITDFINPDTDTINNLRANRVTTDTINTNTTFNLFTASTNRLRVSNTGDIAIGDVATNTNNTLGIYTQNDWRAIAVVRKKSAVTTNDFTTPGYILASIPNTGTTAAGFGDNIQIQLTSGATSRKFGSIGWIFLGGGSSAYGRFSLCTWSSQGTVIDSCILYDKNGVYLFGEKKMKYLTADSSTYTSGHYEKNLTGTLTDDAYVRIPDTKTGWGTIYVDSVGNRLAKIEFSFEADGTVYLDASYKQTYITVDNTDTDGKFDIFAVGTRIRFKNRLGYTVTYNYSINYK